MILPKTSLHCCENLRFNALVTSRFLTHCTSSIFGFLWPLVECGICWHLRAFPTLWTILRFFSDLLGGLTCRGHRLSSFQLSYRQQILTRSYWVRRRCHLYTLRTGLVQEHSIVELHMWLVPNPRQCHWWLFSVFHYLASFWPSCEHCHWFKVVWPWTVNWHEELKQTLFESEGIQYLKPWRYLRQIRRQSKTSAN